MADLTDPQALYTSAGFSTSWRAQLRNVRWGLLGVPVAGLLLWLQGAPLDAFLAWFLGAFFLVAALGMLLLYRIRGVAEVHIDPDRITVRTHGGLERRVERSDLVGLWFEKRWVLKTQDASVTIWDEGFETDDWTRLSKMLYHWKVDSEDGPLPGVVALRSGAGETTTFEVHRPLVPLIAMAAFAAMMLGVAVLSLNAYRDGSWVDDPIITLGFPLAGLALAGLLVRSLPRSVRRAVFLADGVRFERVLGADRMVTYREIVDAHAEWVDAEAGTFMVGRRNSDVFQRLLDERLSPEQLTGRRLVRSLLWFDWRVFVGLPVGALVLWFIASRLGAAWGVVRGWDDVLVGAVLIVYGVYWWLSINVRADRLLRNTDD